MTRELRTADAHEKKPKKFKIQEVGLPGNRSIFINTKLCLYSRMLWLKCKGLHNLGKINKIFLVVPLRLKYLKIGTFYQ